MPVRADMQAAIPRCQRARCERNGQHGVHGPCYALMRYDGLNNYWWCDRCGVMVDGRAVAQGRLGLLAA